MTKNEPTDLPDLADWPEMEPPARPRGLIMRNPLLLGVVAVMAGFLMLAYWPIVSPTFFGSVDCGDITERPSQRKNAPEALPPLEHNVFCSMRGVVQSLHPLPAVPRDSQIKSLVESPQEKLVGVKYYVKLAGDQVYAVLAGDRDDVYRYYRRKDTLLGFNIDGVGHLFDPSADERYESLDRGLRSYFAIPDTQKVMVFNTTATPGDLWPKALAFVALGVTALLALIGLIRTIVLRRRQV